MRRRDAARRGWPPLELLAFRPEDWPQDAPMAAWACWRHAREQWCEDHDGFWPTGEVEMWAEAWAVRPGPTTRPVLPPGDGAGR